MVSTVEILTKEKAAGLGHIAWIEEADPVVAIQKMIAAVETETFNCAVWVNADAGGDMAWRDEVRMWQQHCGLDAPEVSYLKNRCVHENEAAVLNSLVHAFEEASGKRPPDVLQEHMLHRIKTIFKATAQAEESIDVAFELRRQETRQMEGAHADGEPGKRLKIWRFLEAVGMMTYLFSNKDAVGKSNGDLGIIKTRPVTAYQVPDNSLILLTNHGWEKPIVHDNPFLPASQPPQKRTVMVYDMYKMKKWVKHVQ